MAIDWGTILGCLTGGGLVVVLKYITSLPVLRKQAKLDKEDVSRHMAEKDNETILQLYDQVRDLQERSASMEACLQKLVACPYWNSCPARFLVQDYKRKWFIPPGQYRVAKEGIRRPRDRPGEQVTADNTDGQPPQIT